MHRREEITVTNSNSTSTQHLNSSLPVDLISITKELHSEQVWEEGPAKVGLVQDQAHKANHGNAARGHLQLQGRTGV